MYTTSYRTTIGADDIRKFQFPDRDEGKSIKLKFESVKSTQPII